MKVRDIVLREDAKITKSDGSGVEITADDGVKTTLPADKAAALMPDPEKPGEYDLNPQAVASTSSTQPTGPAVGANVEIKTAEASGESGIGTMSTTEFVKGIYAAAAENGMDAPEVEAVKKQMVLTPNGEVDILATMQKAIQVFNSPEWKKMIADLNALIKRAEAQQAANPELARIQELAGMTTEEITDLGNGAQKKTNPDGTYEIGDGSGLKLYSADGKLIKTISPNFAGFSQETDMATGNVTKRYSSGPMSTSQITDKTGKPITSKANYDLGVATLDTELDHKSGVRSNALTSPGMDPNELLPTADIAASKGVDPKKFAAFQQQNPSAVKESSELTAMLKIAGLR